MMFEPAHKTLPPTDYVSMIRSLYADRGTMLLGAFGSAVGAAAAGLKTGSMLLGAIAGLFVLVGIARNIDMRGFEKIDLADDDVATAMRWEIRATIGAAAIAALYGFWCLVSFWIVDDPFAELAATSISVSVLVGVSQRNFAIDRLMTLQVLLIAVPFGLGFLLVGDIYYAALGLLLVPFFASLRRIARNAREVLLRAVHGRLEASALATQLDTALDTLEHGLLMLDDAGIVEVTNERALVAFAQNDHAEWMGRPFKDLLDTAVEEGGLPDTARDRLLDLIDSNTGGKVVLYAREGRYFEVSVSSRNHQTVLLFEDISERIVAEERISFMARYDALTGLPNRAYFSEQTERMLDERSSDDPGLAALWIIDIDDFKHVNDTMGHLAGDRLLAEVATRLPRALGDGALCARLGGDEFIAFCADIGSPDEVNLDAERILEAMKQSFEVTGHRISANVSVGAVLSTSAEDDLDTLMIKADLALYTAKSTGKARVVQFLESMDTEYRLRQHLKAGLREAITNGGIKLVYQPIVELAGNRIVGCEALARWTHPDLGVVPPSIFIPIAEESGMISDLTRHVLETATRDCLAWPGDISVAVNVSARDFRAVDIGHMIDTALEHSGLPANRLEIEVTETAVIEEREAATAALLSLYKRGIGVALDDFGTGYSSLSYLQALPLTKLKIDRSFVADIETNPRSIKLLANVAQLGRDLDLMITAEGIETESQLDFIVNKTGIDQVQGFLFGAPLPAEDIAQLIALHRAAPSEPPQRLVVNRQG
jgi:diguanylate cyclase (GGDEF)-like protein